MMKYYNDPKRRQDADKAAKDARGTHPPLSPVTVKRLEEIEQSKAVTLDDIKGMQDSLDKAGIEVEAVVAEYPLAPLGDKLVSSHAPKARAKRSSPRKATSNKARPRKDG